MALLVIGLFIWVAAHLFKRVAPGVRDPMGDKGKGVVALALLASVVLMVIGFRGHDAPQIWYPPAEFTILNNILVLFGLYFTSPGPSKGALFYKMRHPMLFGFTLWAMGHLLVNGDLASILMFSTFVIWAQVTMSIINKAEPNFTPNPKGTIAKDAMFFVISIVLVGIIGYIHTLFGLMPFGG